MFLIQSSSYLRPPPPLGTVTSPSRFKYDNSPPPPFCPDIRESRKRAKNGYGGETADEPEAGSAAEEAGGPDQKRRYLVNSATKARERFHRNESGGHMQAPPSGFGGRPPNMDDDDDEDYSSSSSDRVSSGRGCKYICNRLFFNVWKGLGERKLKKRIFEGSKR